MKHVWVVAAVVIPLALAGLTAGPAQAHSVGEHPDLVVKNVSTDPYPPEPGTEVDLTVVVENQGDGSGAFNYSFGLDGSLFGQTQTYEAGLASGEKVTLTATKTWTVSSGDHTLNASVEHQDEDLGPQEHATDNNAGEQAYTIGPDLAVTDVTVDPTDPLEGDEVEFSATVENKATQDDVAASAGSFPVTFLVDGEEVTTSVTVEGLAPGESATVTRTWTAQDPGKHGVRGVADPESSTHDRDRSNNDGGPVPIEVRAALPDLVVSSVTHKPDPIEADRQATFTAEIANEGHEDAGEHEVALLVDGETVDRATLDSVKKGGSGQVELTWQAEAGNHDVEVQVDPEGNVSETKEDNNAWTLTLPVGPDLTVRELVVQPSQPRASDRVRFTAEIGNEGQGVSDSFQVAFDVDGRPLDVRNVTGLGADEVRNVTSKAWNATVGDHNVSVIIDPDGAIDEVSAENNRHHRRLTVGEPQPDLTVLSAGLNSSLAQDGDPVTVQTQLENAGPRDAGAFTITATIDGEQVGQVEVDELGARNRTTLDVGPWTAEEGAHELRVEVDRDDRVEELREDNNVLVRAFGIGTDLALTDVSLTPPDPEPGGEVTVLALVENNGTRPTPPANVSFLLDGGQAANASLDPLQPNEQTSIERTFTANRSGTLEVLVDVDEEVEEFDEENNVAAVDLQLATDAAPPDLTVRSVAIEGDLTSGESVRFTAHIVNRGEGPSGRALVDFRVDGSSIGTPVRIPGLAAGESANVTSEPWTPSRTEHELEAHVDPESAVDEGNETNNVHAQTLEGSPAGIPIGAGTVATALLAAALGLGWPGGSKRKPPKT